MTTRRQDATGRPPRVGIVGGGPGGLLTCWELERLVADPLAITILEASGRLGGKVLTPTFNSAAVRYEAGAAEFYDYSPIDDDPLRNLVRGLGLPTVPLAGGSVQVGGRGIANLDDVAEAFGSAGRGQLLAFDAWARSGLSPREFYEAGSDRATSAAPERRFDSSLARLADARLRGYVETMIHSDLATEPSATSTGYGLQNYLMNDPAYMRLYRIADGNERLVDALAERLSATVRLDSPVTRIAPGPDGRLVVASLDRGRPRQDEFDIVVIALPIDPLARIRFDDDLLAAALRRHVAHHDHPAHYLRVTLLLDRPTRGVPGDDDFLMLDAFGGTCLYVESGRDPTARHGVLGWLLGGDAAAEMAGLDDDRLVAEAVASLPGPIAARLGHVLEARVHRWVGAVSALPGGWSPLPVDRRHRPSHAHPNLFVVGDYLYDSTLNGVLDSAGHVAGWIAADLAADRGRPRVAPAGSLP